MKKISKKKLKEILDSYVEAMSQKAKIEKELKEMKALIEDVDTEVEGYDIKVTDCERESLSLKELREYLTIKQLEKYIDPYTKVTEYKRLTVKKVK